MLSLFCAFIFATSAEKLSAQSIAPAGGQSFWDWHNTFITDPSNMINPDEEGSLWQLHQRTMNHWVTRLAPDHDLNDAQHALNTYIEWIGNNPKTNTSFPSNWEEMGPFDTPYANSTYSTLMNGWTGTGQIHNFAFDPDYATNGIMYAASPFGGLFKTMDRGAHWFSITDNKLPYAGVADVVVDPNNGSHLFIATGNVDGFNNGLSIGVYRSFDAGATWQPINQNLVEGEGYIGLHAIEMHPSNPNILLCATNYGILRTTNASAIDPTAVQWTGPYPNTEDNMYKSLFFHPGDPNIVYASGKDIYRSLDGGLNWSSMTVNYPGLDLNAINARRIALGIESISPFTLFANICRWDPINDEYTNYPAMFEQQAEIWMHSASSEFTCNNNDPAWVCIAVRPGQTGTVAYGNTELYNSINAGTTVSLIDDYGIEAHADKHGLAYSPDGNELWIGCDGGAYVTEDVTALNTSTCVIERRNTGLTVATIEAIGSNPTHPEQVLIGTFDNANQLHRRSGDGLTHEWRYVDGGDGGSVCFSPDGNKAWTWIFNNRDSFKKYMINDPLTGPSSGGAYSFTLAATDGLPDALRPVEIPPMGFLPGNNHWLFGANNFYEELDPNDAPNVAADFEQISVTAWADLSPDLSLECLSHSLARLTVHPSQSEYIYFSTRPELVNDESLACYPLRPSAIFASQRDNLGQLLELDHRFATLNMPSEWQSDPVAVTGLAVDPRDPLHIYVGFSGYNPGLKVYEAHINPNDPYSTDWATLDYTNSLPNLPITDLVFAEGTEGGLYASFDVGIYYKNENTLDWQPYFEALPNVLIKDIDINYCAGKIRAGTFGRGLWESDLAEKPHLARVIDADAQWQNHVNLGSDVQVTSGATLTISATVNFAPHTRLIIDPGAQVIVLNGGKLTNLCGEQWDGVEVRGDADLSQVPLTNQGYLELRAGATIEHAEIAVRLFASDDNDIADLNTTGGVVKLLGDVSSPVKISDCKRGIWAKPYAFFNRSLVTYAVFENTTEGSGDYIRLDGIRNVEIRNSMFDYSGQFIPWETMRPTGIRAYNSRFLAVNNTLQHLSQAIRASSTNGLSPCYLRHNTVTGNERGIFLGNINFAELTENVFNVPEGASSLQVPYGLYLSGSTGFEVEENSFAGIGHPANNVGLVIRDSDDGPTEFYRNSFDRLAVGSLLQGDNRLEGSLDAGLQTRCNTYGETSACTYDVALTEAGEVAENQGTSVSPAGNRFYPECPGVDETDIYVDVDPAPATGFNYHHHSDDFTEPRCTTEVYVVTVDAFSAYQGGVACPEELSVDDTRPARKSAFLLASGEHAALKAVYQGEVNGGNTEFLLGLIADASVSSFSVRNALLASSPELTDDVMITAIKRDPAMEDLHLVQVLLANSPLNPDVLIALKGIPLEQIYRELLAEEQNGGMTWKGLVEMELGGSHGMAERGRNDYVRLTLQADTIGTPLDSIAEVLDHTELRASPVARLCMQIAQKDWAEVDDRLANHMDHGLAEEEAIVYAVVRDIARYPSQATGLVQAAEQVLAPIAADHLQPGHEAAKALLQHYLGTTFEEPVILPHTLRSFVPGRRTSTTISDLLSATPNPANERLTVIAKVPKDEVGAYLGLTDMRGQEVQRLLIGTGTQLLELNTRSWAPGLYRLVLFGRRGALDGRSISIVH
ncbi:MAG: NosD domain-containing protein [Flavobacteriales bacterium]